MDFKDLDLNLLRVFDAIYREKNLSRAAARLGITQPGISQALNRLRDSIGDPLFIRQAQGMVPTAYSEAIAKPIQHALSCIQTTLLTEGMPNIADVDRNLHIVMSDYSQALILPRLMKIVQEQAPLLRLEIVADANTDMHGRLYEGDTCLVIGAMYSLDEHFRHEELYREEFICVVRDGHPTIRDRMTVDDFRRAHHVNFTLRKSPIIEQVCQHHQIDRRVSLVVPSLLALPYVIARSDYVAMIARRQRALLPKNLGLKFFEMPFDMPAVIIRQYWSERTHRDPICYWLRQQIKTVCSNLVEEDNNLYLAA